MDAVGSPSAFSRDGLALRARLVGGAAGVGAVVGVALCLLVVAGTGWSLARGARVVFVLGTLAFGVGLLGWAGSMLAGRGVETMQEHLNAGGGWSERRSRRAMARVTGFGAGAMVATGVVEAVAIAA